MATTEKDTRVTVRMDDLYYQLKSDAGLVNRTRSEILREAFREWHENLMDELTTNGGEDDG